MDIVWLAVGAAFAIGVAGGLLANMIRRHACKHSLTVTYAVQSTPPMLIDWCRRCGSLSVQRNGQALAWHRPAGGTRPPSTPPGRAASTFEGRRQAWKSSPGQ